MESWTNFRKQDRIFNSRNGRMYSMRLRCNVAKQANLELKTWPGQLVGSLPLDDALGDRRDLSQKEPFFPPKVFEQKFNSCLKMPMTCLFSKYIELFWKRFFDDIIKGYL
jgi:hypothetical protein